MQREVVLSLAALAGLGSAGYVGYQELSRSFVVNLKDPHPIEGTVNVEAPIPHSATQSLFDVVVAPASRDEPSLWTEAGILETDGFSSVVLSLHGQFRGNPSGPGAVGLVLVPEEENILRALGEGGSAPGPRRGRGDGPGSTPLFQRLPLGPGDRLFPVSRFPLQHHRPQRRGQHLRLSDALSAQSARDRATRSSSSSPRRVRARPG